ncbi:MAG TPA: Gfo/Idh/MocA family oxidoreductase [Bryobacteraceae bacterium]|nr:Gfo/Idh/MocA family oxidoreductase [Bryobacteraceae bacterium]
MNSFDAVIIGGGMITHDQLLPSLYQLRRLGRIGKIRVCARSLSTLEKLASETLRAAFPDQAFEATTEPYAAVLKSMPPRQLAVVAVPDPLHRDVILAALSADLHVCAVKPLVMTVADSINIEEASRARNLFVGIDYHKRFDDRSLMARRAYLEGRFGEFRLGNACLHEKWSYRHSNFQNWCTCENSDAFCYIGCHYVDLVQFITGLEPVAVSVHGLRDRYPNGNEGFLWTDARVIWSNGACLNVQNGLGYPEEGPGSNMQGLTMWCAGADGGAMIRHSDQYRGMEYSYLGGPYSEPSSDYFQYVPLEERGLTPVGYGYRSIERIIDACRTVDEDPRALDQFDAQNLIATPANSRHNERVIEAARKSILQGGREETV